jgi:hypothetical protein
LDDDDSGPSALAVAGVSETSGESLPRRDRSTRIAPSTQSSPSLLRFRLFFLRTICLLSSVVSSVCALRDLSGGVHFFAERARPNRYVSVEPSSFFHSFPMLCFGVARCRALFYNSW